MKKIGILSDTHGYFHPRIPKIFEDCDEIWHAGDIGSLEVYDQLTNIKTLRAVYGNIDNQEIRNILPALQDFNIEKQKVLMIHIGGYPGRYPGHISQMLKNEKPGLFITGHSHILKVMYDKKHNLLYINPGAAGKFGLQQVSTLIKLKIDGKRVFDLEVIELPGATNLP